MSKLQQANGDDYPEAARRHREDASVLLGGSRHDGAAYIAGYVVECALKSLIQLEKGAAAVPKHHAIADLQSVASRHCTLAGARTAKYVTQAVRGVSSLAIASWRPSLRYQAPVRTAADARAWCAEAEQIYGETVAQMFLDGVL